MKYKAQMMYPHLQKEIEEFIKIEISESRKAILRPLIDFIHQKSNAGKEVNLNFICTHNSRRSQFSQLWAHTAAYYYGIAVNCYSGGVEVTAVNERAVASLKRSGFIIIIEGGANPRYKVAIGKEVAPLVLFSKLYDDSVNPAENFAAVMTCSHAEQNCPFIPGADKRLPLLYDDPKEFDGTLEEAKMYDERSRQIATELFYVFSNVNAGFKLQIPKPKT